MINGFGVNQGPINGQPQEEALGDFEGGIVVQAEQSVYLVASEQVIAEFEQELVFQGTAEEQNFVLFEQTIQAQADSQICVQFEQTVKSLADIGKCFVSDWDLVLTVNGAQVPNDQIVGRMEVVRSENDAALLTFSIRPPVGAQDPYDFQGKKVTLDVVQGVNITRVYTGIVDYPTYNLVGETIQYRCTDRRRELINSQLRTAVKSIGYFTESIFGEPVDTADELDKRLTTVPLSVDFDAFGNYTVNSLFPKSTPDYIISSSDIFRRTPRVEVSSRARLVNKYSFNIEYRYSRLHQQVASFTWEHPAEDNICLFLGLKYSLTHKQSVRGAIASSGWSLVNDIAFGELWRGGWYNCFGGLIGWNPIALSGGNVVADTDSSGNPINDANGNQSYSVQGGTYQDTGSLFTNSAKWTAAKRWAQTASEQYTVTLQAPQSISQFGEIEQERNYGVQSEYDDDEWENVDGYDTRYGKLAPFAQSLAGGSVLIDYSDNRSEFNESYLAALNIGKTTILSSHRDNRIIIEVPLSPEYDLKNTIEVSSNKIDGRGKVSRVRHVFDISNKEAYTEAELSLSRAPGSSSDSALSVPNKPSIPSETIGPITLGNHFGEDPSQPGAENWTGMIGNRLRLESAGTATLAYYTQYPESFVVRTPDIPDSLRGNAVGTASASYNVEIPNDPFEIAYVGDCG